MMWEMAQVEIDRSLLGTDASKFGVGDYCRVVGEAQNEAAKLFNDYFVATIAAWLADVGSSETFKLGIDKKKVLAGLEL